MASRLNGFVEGVFVEILWDVESFRMEGRREGERIMDTVWWRGEVLEVKTDRGITTAKIRYDAMGDFKEQIGEVRVFSFHMQVRDDGDITQLKWRYYESSGNVSHDVLDADKDGEVDEFGVSGDSEGVQCGSCVKVNEHAQELSSRMDEIESFVCLRGSIYSRSSTVSDSDQRCEELFSLLRHKVADVVQKPLLGYRQRGDALDAGVVFDWSCAGTLRVEVDCTVAQFEMACCHVKKRCDTCYFIADGRQFTPLSGCLRASVGAAEMLFSTLSELCRALRVCQTADVLAIAKRERRTGKKKGAEDCAIRIAGTYLVDREVEDTPAAVIISGSLHEGLQSTERVHILSRDGQELDPRSMWYKHPLRGQDMDISSLLKYVYPNTSISNRTYRDELSARRAVTGSFALRWRSLSNPNPKLWTRKMVMRPDFAGTLEVHIPYILFRGKRGVEEVKQFVSDEYLNCHLG